MSHNTIHLVCNDPQYVSKEAGSAMDKAAQIAIDTIIYEHRTYTDGHYEIYFGDLDHAEKLSLLSHYIEIEEFEDYIGDPYRELAAIEEYRNDLQKLLDVRCDELWHQDMHEMGATLTHCSQTGEPRYIR